MVEGFDGCKLDNYCIVDSKNLEIEPANTSNVKLYINKSTGYYSHKTGGSSVVYSGYDRKFSYESKRKEPVNNILVEARLKVIVS
jgi:hypothetical protein